MAYVTPSTALTGDLIAAADWNKNTVDNPIALRTGAIALTSQAVGDLVVATSATQLGRVADVATGQVLVSGGVATAPAYSASPSITSLTLATALTVPNGGTGVATQQAYGVLVGGTTSTGAMQSITPGTSTKVLTSAGTGALPAWSQPSNLTQSFRGLTLQTSPDSDLSAANVFLNHADEIVMQDGVSVSDWNDLTANIAVSGAGGLDTGSEGASRWYYIHAIRKSSDGTKNLLLHRAKSYAADQTQATSNTTLQLRDVAARNYVGQTLTAGLSGPAPFVDVAITKVLAPTGNIWCEYRNSTGATVLATSDKLDVSLVSTTAQWVRFIFRTPPTLAASTAYMLVIAGDFTISVTNYVNISLQNTNPYASGTAQVGTSAPVWTSIPASDIAFKTYVTQNDTALTMPSGYDQYAQVGWVYNNSSSNFNAFSARDRDVAALVAQKIGTTTATIGTLVDLTAFLPPSPVTLFLNFACDAATEAGWVAPVPDGYGMAGVAGTSGLQAIRSNGTGVGQPSATFTPLTSDLQGMYFAVGSGTGHFWLQGWKW
jgi:hypothetical protein